MAIQNKTFYKTCANSQRTVYFERKSSYWNSQFSDAPCVCRIDIFVRLEIVWDGKKIVILIVLMRNAEAMSRGNKAIFVQRGGSVDIKSCWIDWNAKWKINWIWTTIDSSVDVCWTFLKIKLSFIKIIMQGN